MPDIKSLETEKKFIAEARSSLTNGGKNVVNSVFSEKLAKLADDVKMRRAPLANKIVRESMDVARKMGFANDSAVIRNLNDAGIAFAKQADPKEKNALMFAKLALLLDHRYAAVDNNLDARSAALAEQEDTEGDERDEIQEEIDIVHEKVERAEDNLKEMVKSCADDLKGVESRALEREQTLAEQMKIVKNRRSRAPKATREALRRLEEDDDSNIEVEDADSKALGGEVKKLQTSVSGEKPSSSSTSASNTKSPVSTSASKPVVSSAPTMASKQVASDKTNQNVDDIAAMSEDDSLDAAARALGI